MKSDERDEVQTKIQAFDKNGDQVFDFDEFKDMMESFEPKISGKLVLDLFKQAVEENHKAGFDEIDQLSLEQLTNLIIKYQIGGHGKQLLSDWLLENKPKQKISSKFGKSFAQRDDSIMMAASTDRNEI